MKTKDLYTDNSQHSLILKARSRSRRGLAGGGGGGRALWDRLPLYCTPAEGGHYRQMSRCHNDSCQGHCYR